MKPACRALIPLLLIVSAAAHAEDNEDKVEGRSVGPLFPAPGVRLSAPAAPPPPRLTQMYGVAPLAVLPPAEKAARAELAALQAWNEAGRLPVRNGFTRPLPSPRLVEIDAGALSRTPMDHAGGILTETAFGRLAWGAEVRVPEAYRLRARLTDVRLPKGTRLWVHGDQGEVAGPFGLELRGPNGDLWTPSVGGEAIRLDVELPAGIFDSGQEGARFGFRLAEVLEIVPVEGEDAKAGELSCEIDLACADRNELPFLDAYRHAVARLLFVRGGGGFLCTGALLNDTDTRTEIPYLLTAHHCIAAQDEAASLDAFWDYYRTSCGGVAPALNQVPRSDGATLLATSDDSDFTLLRLERVPPGRVFLGWNAERSAIAEDVRLYRLAHSGGRPQSYSVTRVDPFVSACRDRPRPNFIYSTRISGATAGGSSGGPMILADGRVVGQLLGGCGDADDCSPGQATVDGAFSFTFPRVRQFLAPPQPCTPGPTHLCLDGNRFRVELAWRNQYDGTSGVARSVPRTDSTGFFYFQDPSNFELIVKILDFGDVVKVFYGQLTDLLFSLTVTDTRTGDEKTYLNSPSNCGAIDQAAFPGSSATSATSSAVFETVKQGGPAKSGTCAADADTLCLLDRRFSVEVSWRNQFNNESGKAQPATLTQQAGMFSYTDRSNIELVVKALNFGDRVLFFWGALSDLEYTITLTDTQTGAAKTYNNPAGRFCGGLDGDAF